MKIDLTAHVFASADGTETLYWRGDKYVNANGYGTYHEGATIARTRDGWDINVNTKNTRSVVSLKSASKEVNFNKPSEIEKFFCVAIPYECVDKSASTW